MPTLIAAPTVLESAGDQSKRLAEYAGRVETGDE
jgi:hypothetical protein